MLALLTLLPTILSKTNLVLFCPPKSCFVTLYTIFMVLGTPTRCSISYRFRGSPCLITPHLVPISNYASSSPFWKSAGSYRLPNRDLSKMQLQLTDQTRARRGGKEKEWTDCVQSDIRAFGIAGDWKATALKAEVWVETVTEGGRRFMAAWSKEEVDTARHRQEKREATRLGTVLSQTGV